MAEITTEAALPCAHVWQWSDNSTAWTDSATGGPSLFPDRARCQSCGLRYGEYRRATRPAPRIAATREWLAALLRDAWRLGDADRGLILKLDRERWIAGRLDELEREGA